MSTYHLGLNNIHKILRKAYRRTLNSIRLPGVLPLPPKVAFRNPKILKCRFVRSKLTSNTKSQSGVFKFGHTNCEICNFLKHSN